MIPVKITAKFYEIDIRMIFIKIGRFAKSDSLWEIYIFQDLYNDLYTFFLLTIPIYVLSYILFSLKTIVNEVIIPFVFIHHRRSNFPMARSVRLSEHLLFLVTNDWTVTEEQW